MRDSKFADRRIFIFIFCLLAFLLLLFLLHLFLHFAFTGPQALFADSRLLLLLLRTIREPRLVYTFLFAAVGYRKTIVRRQHAFFHLSSSAAIR